VLEMMGNEIFLYLLTKDDKELVARGDPRSRAKVNDEMEVLFDMKRMQVFDPQTEKAIR
jgi:multiple sugar transport system ATP-binding protein